jgi:hypothetical protein
MKLLLNKYIIRMHSIALDEFKKELLRIIILYILYVIFTYCTLHMFFPKISNDSFMNNNHDEIFTIKKVFLFALVFIISFYSRNKKFEIYNGKIKYLFKIFCLIGPIFYYIINSGISIHSVILLGLIIMFFKYDSFGFILFCFYLESLSIFNSVLGFSTTDQMLNIFLLSFFCFSTLFSSILKIDDKDELDEKDNISLILVTVSLFYLYPLLEKIKISKFFFDWFLIENISFEFLHANFSGWLNHLSHSNIHKITNLLSFTSPYILLLAIGVEALGFILVYRKTPKNLRLLVPVAWFIFHISIFLLAGIVFWKWILVNLFLFIIIYKENVSLNIHKSSICLLFILSLAFYIKPIPTIPRLAWYRTSSFSDFYVVAVVNGNKFEIPNSLFSPYEIVTAMENYSFLVDGDFPLNYSTDHSHSQKDLVVQGKVDSRKCALLKRILCHGVSNPKTNIFRHIYKNKSSIHPVWDKNEKPDFLEVYHKSALGNSMISDEKLVLSFPYPST